MDTLGKTRVVITHDCALVAAGIASTLRRQPDLEVTINAPFQQRTQADVIIGSCREAVRLVSMDRHASTASAPRVVMVTTQESQAEIRAALVAGIHDLLSIDCAEDDLVAAVRRTARAVLTHQIESRSADRGARAAHHANPVTRGGLAPGVLRRVRHYIEAHLDGEILVKTLADIAGLSVYHFARAFKQSVGVPPHRFVLERRMSKAAQLIRQNDMALSDVALAVGCADQSHFTTVFRRIVGATPSAFRRAAL